MLRLDYNRHPFQGVEPPMGDGASLQNILQRIGALCGVSADQVRLVKGASPKLISVIMERFSLGKLHRYMDSHSRWIGERPGPKDFLYLHWHLRFWDPALKETASWRICDSREICGVGGFSLVLLPPEIQWEGEPLSPLYLPVLEQALKEAENRDLPTQDEVKTLRDYAVSMLATEVPECLFIDLDRSLPNSFSFTLPGVSVESVQNILRTSGILLEEGKNNLTLSFSPFLAMKDIDSFLGELVPVLNSAIPEGMKLAPPEFSLKNFSAPCGGGCCSGEKKKDSSACGSDRSCGQCGSTEV